MALPHIAQWPDLQDGHPSRAQDGSAKRDPPSIDNEMAGYWRGWINAISGIDEIADRGGLTFFPRRRGCNRSSGKPSIQHSPIRVEDRSNASSLLRIDRSAREAI